ncbi:hypothetical protein BKA70DRAFT_1219788 [Coprinopsis sp. MPI-PUGE-AT-0042]|nr:hypothetical protein BKA70DRAFT_1219788 [Coprinopsis sp. MPI-PUGE-AT-0042]
MSQLQVHLSHVLLLPLRPTRKEPRPSTPTATRSINASSTTPIASVPSPTILASSSSPHQDSVDPTALPKAKKSKVPPQKRSPHGLFAALDGIDPPPPEADPNYVPPPVRLGSGPHYHIADDGKWWRCPPEQARFEKKMAADKAFALRFGPKIPAKKRLKWADMVDELLDPVFVYPPFPWGTLGQSVVELDETLEALHAMQEDPKLAKDAMSRWPAMGDPAKVVEAEKDDPPVMTRDGVPAPPTQVLDWKPHESGAILPTVPDQVAPLIFRHANDHDRWGKRRGPKSPFNSFDASATMEAGPYQEMGAVPKMIVPSMFLGSYEEQGAPKVPRPIRSILKKTTKYPDTVYRSVDKLHHKTVVSPPLLQEWRLAEHWEEGPMTPRGSRDQPGKLPMGWDQTVEVKEEYPSASEIVNRPVVLPYDHEAGRYLTPFDDGYHTSKALPPIPSAPSDTGSLRSNPSFDPKNDVSIADALSDAWDPILQLPMQQPSISRAARRSSIARAIRRLPPHDADPDLRPETEGAMADSLSDVWGMVKELSSKEEAMRGSKVVSSSKTTPPVENTTVSSVKGQIVPSIKVVETKTTTPSRQPAFRLSVTEDNTIDAPEPVSFGLSSLPAVSNLALLADPKVRFTFSGEGRKTGMTVEAIRSSTVQVKSDPRVFDVAVAKVEECLRRLHEEPVVPAPPAASPSSSSSSTPSSTPPAVSPSSPSSSSAPSSAPAPAEVQAPVATAVGASFEERKMARLNQAMLNIRRLMKERGITKLPPSFLAGLVPTEEGEGSGRGGSSSEADKTQKTHICEASLKDGLVVHTLHGVGEGVGVEGRSKIANVPLPSACSRKTKIRRRPEDLRSFQKTVEGRGVAGVVRPDEFWEPSDRPSVTTNGLSFPVASRGAERLRGDLGKRDKEPALSAGGKAPSSDLGRSKKDKEADFRGGRGLIEAPWPTKDDRRSFGLSFRKRKIISARSVASLAAASLERASFLPAPPVISGVELPIQAIESCRIPSSCP